MNCGRLLTLYVGARFITKVLESPVVPGTNVPKLAGKLETAFEKLKFVPPIAPFIGIVAIGTFITPSFEVTGLEIVGTLVDVVEYTLCPPRIRSVRRIREPFFTRRVAPFILRATILISTRLIQNLKYNI